MNIKSAGRLAALLLLAGLVTIALYAAWRGTKKTAPSPPSIQDFGPPPATRAENTPSTASRPQDLVAMADEGLWTRVEPGTNSVVSMMTWKRLDPAGEGEFDIQSPTLWVIDQDRTLRVSGRAGRIVWPSRDAEPESGSLQGAVALQFFDTPSTNDQTLTANSLLGTLRTEEIFFVGISREVRSEGPFEAIAPGMKLEGKGITLRLGGERRVPVSLFRIEREARFEYNPAEAREHADRLARPASESSEDADPARASTAEEAWYRVELNDSIDARTPSFRLATDAITGHIKLTNGRLRDGAIATFEPAEPRPQSVNSSPTAEPTAPTAPEPLIIQWKGALEIRALPAAPQALERDDLVIQTPESDQGRVRIERLADNTTITASGAEYRATQRRFNAKALQATIADTSSITVRDLAMDLTTGVGSTRGPGEAWLLGDASGSDAPPLEKGPKPRGTTWNESADFTLDTSKGPVGSVPVLVKDLRLAGAVDLREGNAGVRAGALRAYFQPSDASAGEPQTTLTRLAFTESVRASDARGGEVAGTSIDVLFEPSTSGEPTPTIATIQGGASARRETDGLEADFIEAALRRDDEGDIEIASVLARDAVTAHITRQRGAEREERIQVGASLLRADASLGTLELVGEPANIRRDSGSEQAEINGGSMSLRSSHDARGLTVFGPGTARFKGPAPENASDDARIMSVTVTWQASALYDDLKGRAELEGAAEADVLVGELEHHKAKGRSVIIELAPENPQGERPLARALIEGEDETPAEIELRAYRPELQPGAPRTLEALALLRGPIIDIRENASKLIVPAAGMLLFEDRRPADRSPQDEPAPESPIDFRGTRGTTLFTWDNAMSIDRAAGKGELSGNVLIRHRDTSKGRLVELSCREARFESKESSTPEGNASIDLVRAEAAGDIVANYGPLQLLSDRLIYDAPAQRLVIAAEPSRTITIHDSEKGQTFSGEAAIINLATNEYRFEKLESVSIPR